MDCRVSHSRKSATSSSVSVWPDLLESCLKDDAGGLDAEVEAITKMGLSDFETYIEILVALRGAFHRKYIIESLDATMLKNKAGALLAQTRARNAPRRFALDSRLLEVLLQIAVLRPVATRATSPARCGSTIC